MSGENGKKTGAEEAILADEGRKPVLEQIIAQFGKNVETGFGPSDSPRFSNGRITIDRVALFEETRPKFNRHPDFEEIRIISFFDGTFGEPPLSVVSGGMIGSRPSRESFADETRRFSKKIGILDIDRILQSTREKFLDTLEGKSTDSYQAAKQSAILVSAENAEAAVLKIADKLSAPSRRELEAIRDLALAVRALADKKQIDKPISGTVANAVEKYATLNDMVGDKINLRETLAQNLKSGMLVLTNHKTRKKFAEKLWAAGRISAPPQWRNEL